MDEKYLWIGGGLLFVVVLVMSRGSSGAVTINRTDPNAAAEAQSRSDFAARGLQSLASVAQTDIGGSTTRYVADVSGQTTRYVADVSGGVSKYLADAQVRAQESRDAAIELSARYASDAQITAAKASARASTNNGFFNMVGNVAKIAIAFLAF